MPDRLRAVSRLRTWYETTRHPTLILAALVVLLYFPSLFGGFVLDDHRCLRMLGEFHRGERPSLDVYRFLFGGQANCAARQAGWYPWWITDELRYRHLRPVSEWVLYAEYLIFADKAIGFRLVGLALYAVGVALVLRLFRIIGGDEALARWAALLFAVAAGHTVPVVFVSNHCDVIALVLAAGSVLAVGRFIRDGRLWRLAVGAALFGMGLFAKEAVLPVAVLPVCLWLTLRGRPGAASRAVVATGLLAAGGLAWLAYYAYAGYGSNAVLILDPLHAPAEYLASLPLRAVILLSTWVIPLNPFVLLLHQEGGWLLSWYALAGGGVLAVLAVMYWRRHRRQHGVAAMALWPLPFLPLLACTAPDDRVMVLPSIGLAFLGAAWLTGPRPAGVNRAATVRERSTRQEREPLPYGRGSDLQMREPAVIGRTRLRAIPLILFVVVQIAMVFGTVWGVQFLESESQRHLRMTVEGFGRPPSAGDHVFFINSPYNFETLFSQDRLCGIRGRRDVKVSVLCDIPAPTVKVIDSHTLRLESDRPPFFSSFVGMMGASRTPRRREGDTYDAGEFQARLAAVRDGQVQAVELRFRQPLASDSYRFYWSTETGLPVPAPQVYGEAAVSPDASAARGTAGGGVSASPGGGI